MAITATASGYLYFGPNSSTYVRDININGTVTVLWKEGTWYYVETNTSLKRRNYIESLTNITGGTPEPLSPNLLTRYVNAAGSTYLGPETTYTSGGSLGIGDTVKYLEDKRQDDFVLVEYKVANSDKKKRAWFYHMRLTPSRPPFFIDPVDTTQGYVFSNHKDYPVPTGTPVYAMCDGTFTFAYYYGKKYSNSEYSYISLGRGISLKPDSGWKTADGRTTPHIEYSHLSSLSGYSTPNYVENCYPSSLGTNYEENQVVLENKWVECGELIGYSGNSGNSSGSHLHILLR